MNTLCGALILAAAFSSSAVAQSAGPATMIAQTFTGVGDGPTYNAAIEAAIRNAIYNAGSQRYSNCQVTNYVYYQNPMWLSWQAKAWVNCTKNI